MNFWQRIKAWRDRIPEKRELSVHEIFFRLHRWQRALLVLGCVAIIYKFQAPVFAMNVGPHIAKLWNLDGSFNWAEWSIVENQSAGVITLAIGALLIGLPKLNIVQRVLIVPAMVMAIWMNVGNGTETQTAAFDARNSSAVQHNARIDTLTKQVEDNTAAWNNAAKPEKRATQAMVAVVEKAAKELEKSAYDECHSVARGPKCAELEKKHARKLEEVAKTQADKDATDFLLGIEAAISADKAELKGLGPKVEHANSLSVWTNFLASLGVLSEEKAKALTDFKPVTDTIGAEVFASCMTVPCLVGWVLLWGLFTCRRGEVHESLLDLTKDVSANVAAAVAAKVAVPPVQIPLSVVPHVEDACSGPDADPVQTLGLERDHAAELSETASTKAQIFATEVLKNDPEKPRRPRGRKKAAHRESVPAWYKVRVIERLGRKVAAGRAYNDYKTFCEEANREPVTQPLFWKVLSEEKGLQKDKNGRNVMYLDIDLHPVKLRIVEAAASA